MDQTEIQRRIAIYKSNWFIKNQIVTLFMLTHKRPYYVKLAVESVLAQTYDNFYLIILDNNSFDNTKEVIENFQDERIVYIERESIVGNTNYKFAFDNCLTKYFAILHDDDILENNFLDEQLKTIESNCEYAVVTAAANIIDENGKVKKMNTAEDKLYVYAKDEYFNFRFRFANIPQLIYPSAIYRKSFFKDRDVFFGAKAGPAGDQFLWFQIERYGGIIVTNGKSLFNYRTYLKQASRYNAGKMDIVLLNYLFSDDYYRSKIISNKKYIFLWIKNCFKSVVANYVLKIYSIEEAKKIYNLIDKRIIITFNAKKWFFIFKTFTIFPHFFACIYVIFKKTRRKNIYGGTK